MRQERLDLAAVDQAAAVVLVVEGLDAEQVARAHQALLRRVPDGDGEHAAQLLEHAGSPRLVAVHDGLGVAVRDELVAQRLQLGAQLLEVVDLAVECDGDGAARVLHGLARALEVDDAQAAKAHGDAVVHEKALVVGPAMGDAVGHVLDDRPVGVGAVINGGESHESAHAIGSSCVRARASRAAPASISFGMIRHRRAIPKNGDGNPITPAKSASERRLAGAHRFSARHLDGFKLITVHVILSDRTSKQQIRDRNRRIRNPTTRREASSMDHEDDITRNDIPHVEELKTAILAELGSRRARSFETVQKDTASRLSLSPEQRAYRIKGTAGGSRSTTRLRGAASARGPRPASKRALFQPRRQADRRRRARLRVDGGATAGTGPAVRKSPTPPLLRLAARSSRPSRIPRAGETPRSCAGRAAEGAFRARAEGDVGDFCAETGRSAV